MKVEGKYLMTKSKEEGGQNGIMFQQLTEAEDLVGQNACKFATSERGGWRRKGRAKRRENTQSIRGDLGRLTTIRRSVEFQRNEGSEFGLILIASLFMRSVSVEVLHR